MPGKTPDHNGKEPVENGVRSNSNDATDGSKKTKAKKLGNQDGDDEMTVVLPPSKKGRPSSNGQILEDADGDVSMGGDKDESIEADEAKLDPVAQAVAGQC